MPIYEYGCSNCGYEFEEMQKITAEPISDCPECGQPTAKRFISKTSFVLRGSGWYVTDYGKGTGGAAGETKKKPDKKDTESTSKTESKSSSSDSSSSKSDS